MMAEKNLRVIRVLLFDFKVVKHLAVGGTQIYI